MRVIGINAVYGLLSTGRTVKQLDEGLEKYGVESTTVYFAGPGTARDYRMNTEKGVRLHSLAARLSGRAGYYSFGATRRLLKYLDEQKPDLVHLHNLHSNFICLPMLFNWLAENGVPTVVTLHDCWWYTGKCTHYTADGCMKWQTGCGGCVRLKKDIPSWFFDRTAKMLADKQKWFASVHLLAVLGVSDWITNEAKKSFLGKADIIKRVYNWIDTDIFSPTPSDVRRRYGLETGCVMLAVSGKWIPSKGLGALIELSRRLPEDMHLVLIGEAPEETSAEIPNITLIPATESQRELAEWYSAADIFITLSPEESFGKVSAEALACGTPVIALNSTASPELVGDNCGAVIEDSKPQTVLAAADKLMKRGKAAYADACRRFACDNFDMDLRIRDIAGVYNELVKMREAGRKC